MLSTDFNSTNPFPSLRTKFLFFLFTGALSALMIYCGKLRMCGAHSHPIKPESPISPTAHNWPPTLSTTPPPPLRPRLQQFTITRPLYPGGGHRFIMQPGVGTPRRPPKQLYHRKQTPSRSISDISKLAEGGFDFHPQNR